MRSGDRLFERLVLEINQAEGTRRLSDAGIVQNRLKVDAAIRNAVNILNIRSQHGSFASCSRLLELSPAWVRDDVAGLATEDGGGSGAS